MWCEPHQCWKTRNWVKLCQTREDYRQAWDEGRGPGQSKLARTDSPNKPPDELPPAVRYLKCMYRGKPVAATTGSMVGCGCGGTKVEFYDCQFFHEPVLKDCKNWAKKANQAKILEICPDFAGKTCRACQVPIQPF